MTAFDFDKPIVINNKRLDPHNQILCRVFNEKADLFTRLDLIPHYFLRKIFTSSCLKVMPNDITLKKIPSFDKKVKNIMTRKYTVNEKSQKIILYFHGGAFTLGNIDSHDGICRAICKTSNVNLINFNYRLAPENKYPAAQNDAMKIYQYLIEEKKINPCDIIFIGESAGANLAISLSIKLNQIRYPQPGKIIMVAPPSGQLHYFGTQSGITFRDGPSRLDLNSCKKFTEYYVGNGDYNDPMIFPILQEDFSFLPQALICTAGFDILHDDGIALYHKIKKQNDNVYHICFDTLTHEFMFLYHHIPVVSELFKLIDKFIKFDDTIEIEKSLNDAINNIVLYELSEK